MRWKLKQNTQETDVKHLQEVLGLDYVLAQMLVQRGITSFDQARTFFRPSLEELHDPFLMKDMDLAVDRILIGIQNNQKILIYGDYDVDGTTSVALLYRFIKSFYDKVQTYIPDRYSEGYGISNQGIEFAIEQKIDLIISIDCGIKDIEEIAFAKLNGIDFIVCDHHMPGDELPLAQAILDPKRVDCTYPYKELCGCGVGFKFIQAIAQTKNMPLDVVREYLDLVAIAIVADLVPLTGENRIMAYFGLKIINKSPRAGIKALLDKSKNKPVTISDIVYKIGPKINAAGRVNHGKFAVQLLATQQLFEAELLVKSILALNEERKVLDQAITKQALQQIIDNKEINNMSTVVYDPHWHKGVIGIVAARLIDTYYRPTIVFTQSGDYLAASARSVKNFDIYKAIESCSELLIQFGGHKYAAGLTLKKENFVLFKQKFELVVEQTIQENDLIPEIEIDAIINLDHISDKFVRILKQFEPFGQGNPKPLFLAKNIYDIGRGHTMGKNQEHLKLYLRQRGGLGKTLPVVGYRFGHYFTHITNRRFFDFVFSIEENYYFEKSTLQLAIKDMQLV